MNDCAHANMLVQIFHIGQCHGQDEDVDTLVGSDRAFTDAQSETQSLLTKIAEDQKKQAEDQKKQAEDQKKQAKDQKKRDAENAEMMKRTLADASALS